MRLLEYYWEFNGPIVVSRNLWFGVHVKIHTRGLDPARRELLAGQRVSIWGQFGGVAGQNFW